MGSSPSPFLVFMCQVLSLPVHPLRPQQHPDRGGPYGQLRRHPDELPGFGGNQAAANQSHAEEAVQGNADGTGGPQKIHIGQLFIVNGPSGQGTMWRYF